MENLVSILNMSEALQLLELVTKRITELNNIGDAESIKDEVSKRGYSINRNRHIIPGLQVLELPILVCTNFNSDEIVLDINQPPWYNELEHTLSGVIPENAKIYWYRGSMLGMRGLGKGYAYLYHQTKPVTNECSVVRDDGEVWHPPYEDFEAINKKVGQGEAAVI